ncbi:hypothetical protein ACWEQ3_46710, partial [Streptomyces mirabilis]
GDQPTCIDHIAMLIRNGTLRPSPSPSRAAINNWYALVVLTEMQMSVVQRDDGEMWIRQEFPAEEVVESAAVRLRPILLEGDACFYQKALRAVGYFCRASPQDTEWVRATRAEWRSRVNPATAEEAGYWVVVSNAVTGENRDLHCHL